LLTIQDAHDDHYEPGPADLGCRLRAKITARGAFGEAVADTEWSPPITAQSAISLGGAWGGITGVRTAGAVAVAGATIVIGSLLARNPYPEMTRFGYRGVVALMSVGVIVLIGFALRSNRRAPLLGGTGLALALLGVTFPISWSRALMEKFPTLPAFWVGACGAAVAAFGATVAAWLALAEPPTASGASTGRTRSPTGRVVLAISGALIVIGSLFVLPEWSAPPGRTTWQNWKHDSLFRYPSAIILLSGLVIALSAAGVRLDRRRLLLAAAGVACLLLGETVPLIFTDPSGLTWGSGRWLRIGAAVAAVAGLAAAAATMRRDTPASLGKSMTGEPR
jgi:hypothetical protein